MAACQPVKPTRSAFQLVCHPGDTIRGVHSITVDVGLVSSTSLRLVYRLSGDVGSLRIADRAKPGRHNELWRHTCFEFFINGAGAEYWEFNFSPSLRWAAYQFDSYREAMADLKLTSAPRIQVEVSATVLTLEALLEAHELMLSKGHGGRRMALAAVIEHRDGYLSHWALAHAPGKPDFHHHDGFVGVLPDNVV